MLDHALIAIDGSPTSHFSARAGYSLARQAKARVTLLFVLEPPTVIPVGPLSGYVVTAPPRSHEELERARSELRSIAKEFSDVATEVRVEVGSPADTICELADKLGVDLIVVGARGVSQASKWLMGGVSDRVAHHAHCPVMIVRDRQKP